MNASQIFIETFETLNSNKLRSGLTVLGIVIGVAAVIAMLAVGNGAQASITSSINQFGTNLLFVFKGAKETSGITNTRPPRALTVGDTNALLDPYAAPDIQAVAPVVQDNGTADFGGQTKSVSILGATPSYQQVHNLSLLEGDFISEEQNLGRASVAVIGVDVADKLFGHRDGLVGETVRISGQPFRVIGVLTAQGGNSFGSQDGEVIVPLNTALSRLVSRSGSDTVDNIAVQATDSSTVNAASDEIAQILRSRHRTPIAQDDFTIQSQQSMLNSVQSVVGVLTIFLGGIAAISLLVGGIGIMNIMLVSVTERTREIGLRKALGARKRDILIQFLAESALLSLVGGIIGILFGWLIAFIVGKVATATGNSFTPVVSLGAVLMATLFSAAVGVFFGIYPANRAASLQPVEALRYE